MKINRLVLASTSKYRRALLDQVGIIHHSLAPEVDEDSITADDPASLAWARSEAKGLSLPFDGTPFLAIAADQVLDFEGQAFGKAHLREDAKARLSAFSGKTHTLQSAYSLVLYTPKGPSILKTEVVPATMHMRKLSEGEIEAYLDTNEWKGCAGCYQYENKGMNLFESIEADISTIIGLPLPHLLKDLRDLGINVLSAPNGPWTLQEIS
ncbi:MAG: nucleoside triphosphate pyrophosphatase [Bdellovibrionota bacterium]|nr:MAG: Maf-like protein [Pseudomonadota bacterium]